MEKNNIHFRFKFFIGVLILATSVRILTAATMNFNFAPIDAIALFSGAYFSKDKILAISLPICTVWIGDLFIDRIFMQHWTLFYPGWYWQYGCYGLITVLGFLLAKRLNVINIVITSLLASSLFFVISNFGVWYEGLMYPLTWDGLVWCYIAAIPFFKNTLLSDLFYSVVLFGSVIWVEHKFSALQPSK